MDTQRRFNLVDEAWIPAGSSGRVSLREIFSRPDLTGPGGTPLEKIALFKLLQAIAQAAATPATDEDWRRLGPDGLAERCLAYLDRWHDAFWLYGPAPFLQFPAVAKAKLLPYGSLLPHVASGNTSVLFQSQVERPLDDARKALLLLVNMSCCFSGKKVDKSVALSPGVTKGASAKAGPAICALGLLHSFLVGRSPRETVWLNLLTREHLAQERLYEDGVGTPPWEAMPLGEEDGIAASLKRSLMGRLVPMARFCLLEDGGVRSVEGIQHPDYLQGGMVDPSVAGDRTLKKPRMIWADPQKRPWRMLPSLLSFLHHGQTSSTRCLQLLWCVPRLAETPLEKIAVWSGGIRLRSNAGEQYLSGSDDVVASELELPKACLGAGEENRWFASFRIGMEELEVLGRTVSASVAAYYRAEKAENAGERADRASLEFWQMAERHCQDLVTACGAEDDGSARDRIVRALRGCALECYARACPRETARQLQLWALHCPFSRNKRRSGEKG